MLCNRKCASDFLNALSIFAQVINSKISYVPKDFFWDQGTFDIIHHSMLVFKSNKIPMSIFIYAMYASL